MKGFIEVLANHVCGIVCAVGTVCGIPFFYSLISGFDLNTDMARAFVTVVGVLISGVSFALGWNQRGSIARQEKMEMVDTYGSIVADKDNLIAAKTDIIAGKDAAIQREKEKNAELAARWEKLNSEEHRIRKEIERMSVYDKAALRDMYLRPGGRELAIDHVENPEAMPLVRKGITELSEVHVEDDGYRFVHECLTLAAHDVIRDHPELVGIDGSDVQIAKEA